MNSTERVITPRLRAAMIASIRGSMAEAGLDVSQEDAERWFAEADARITAAGGILAYVEALKHEQH